MRLRLGEMEESISDRKTGRKFGRKRSAHVLVLFSRSYNLQREHLAVLWNKELRSKALLSCERVQFAP